MDLSFQRRFAPDGRKEREECFCCGLESHRVAVCLKPDNRPLSQLRQFRASYVHRSGSPDSAKFVSPSSSTSSPTNEMNLG
jgi:hypothetical protein